MSDIALDLDPTSSSLNDLAIVDNDLALTATTLQGIQQHILQRLRIYLGEWFLDTTIGLPYFQQILVKNPIQSDIDALYVNQILGTPGVDVLNSYSFVPDFVDRALTIAFSAKTTAGTVDYQSQIQV